MKNSLFLSLLALSIIASAQQYNSELFQNLNIRNVGPANMSGRITAIDVVESNPKVMFVGAASGGVWKSENGGTRWEPVFDDAPTQNIGAIAIQQSNPSVVWVGTGEGNPRNSMNLGMGLFKSLDGGKTWKHVGLEKTKVIHRIIVHPTNPDIVFVGAMGDTFTPTEDRGLYKTIDGGETWKKILYSNKESGIADMVMDPKNPNKLIVALYEHRRTPFSFRSGGPGSGLYMTLDAGETWEKLSSKNGLPKGDLGRIGLAMAPSNPNRVYAKVEAKRNALYRSEDGGHSWRMINNNPRYTNNRPFYFQDLAVDSKDPNRLYNIYQPLSVSYDGGESFDPVPQIPADETKGIHADFHAFWMSPDDPDFYIIGGDGGIGITRDKGKSWFFPETIPVGQFYQVNVDEEMPYNVYGGLQDNGNWYGPGYVWRRGGIRTLYWQYLVGGDGFYISPDSEDARFGYGTSQNGSLYRYDKVGGYYSSIKPPQPEDKPRLRFNWNAGFAQDPHDPASVYYASQYLHKSTDRGASWEIISPDLTNNNPEQQKRDYGGLTLDASGAEFYNSILAVAPSPVEKNVIWVGTDDGNVQLTKDAGASWTNLTKNIKGLPKESWIARIHASEYDAETAWVVVNNYRKGDYTPYLFKTENSGKSWESVLDGKGVFGYSLSFIQDPVEPNLVFLGTENGLWISLDRGKNWKQFKNGFPSVSTMGLAIQSRESALIIGTFGRSIWVLDDLKSLREATGNKLTTPFNVIPTNDAVQVKGIFINAPGNIWTGFHTTFQGENRPFKRIQIPFFISQEPQDSIVTLKVYNDKDRLIQEEIKQLKLVNGLNYAVWKLDEKIDRLPGAWVSNESRGIPVLPGNYKVVLEYSSYSDSTMVKVIPDPRFDFDPKVDEALYQAQKDLNTIRKSFADALKGLNQKETEASKLRDFLSERDKHPELRKSSEVIIQKIEALGKVAFGTRPDKQVGAWQSFEMTPSRKIRECSWKFMSAHRMLSDQELNLLRQAAQMVNDFIQQVDSFNENDWKELISKVEDSGLDWF